MTFRRIDGRGQYGPWHRYTLDGKRIPGVTTLLRDGVPKPALIEWKARVTAEFAVAEQDTWSRMAPDAAINYLKTEAGRQATRAAARGTEIHELATRIVAGHDVDVDETLIGVVNSYVQFLKDWNPDPVAVEFSLLNRRWWYAGTGDLLAQLDGFGLALLDIKTGSGVYPETALQLAAYRHAEQIQIDGRLEPMPVVEFVGVVWLQDDGYQLLPVTAGRTEFEAFLHAAFVASFCGRDRDDLVGGPLEVDQ